MLMGGSVSPGLITLKKGVTLNIMEGGASGPVCSF